MHMPNCRPPVTPWTGDTDANAFGSNTNRPLSTQVHRHQTTEARSRRDGEIYRTPRPGVYDRVIAARAPEFVPAPRRRAPGPDSNRHRGAARAPRQSRPTAARARGASTRFP